MLLRNSLLEPLRALLQDGVSLESKVNWNEVLETYGVVKTTALFYVYMVGGHQRLSFCRCCPFLLGGGGGGGGEWSASQFPGVTCLPCHLKYSRWVLFMEIPLPGSLVPRPKVLGCMGKGFLDQKYSYPSPP